MTEPWDNFQVFLRRLLRVSKVDLDAERKAERLAKAKATLVDAAKPLATRAAAAVILAVDDEPQSDREPSETLEEVEMLLGCSQMEAQSAIAAVMEQGQFGNDHFARALDGALKRARR